MALKRSKLKLSKTKTFCLKQIDPSFYNKIMARSSSVGDSSRLSFHHSPSHVALDWEVRPGRAKYENPDSTMPLQLPYDTRDTLELSSFGSDTDETSCRSSTSVSSLPSSPPSSSLPSTTCFVKSTKFPLKGVARGLMKWVFTKHNNKYLCK